MLSKFTPYSKIYIKIKRPVIAKTILKNERTVEGPTLPYLKTYYKAIDIKIVVLA